MQRGLLRRLAGQDDDAREDFEKAAELGSEFARQQAVALNPYAALCNKMLSEVIGKLRNPSVWDTATPLLYIRSNKIKTKYFFFLKKNFVVLRVFINKEIVNLNLEFI